MLITAAPDIRSSEITDEKLYVRRREFLQGRPPCRPRPRSRARARPRPRRAGQERAAQRLQGRGQGARTRR
ncbi:MAG: hypothetical protein MZW92_53540 [Comamonadaceae bacterium]|nr:hypothetical protein [Comamonadaceae bacterium]